MYICIHRHLLTRDRFYSRHHLDEGIEVTRISWVLELYLGIEGPNCCTFAHGIDKQLRWCWE